MRRLAHRHHPQVWLQGSEGVVGNLRLGGGDAGDQRGLAGVGIPHQPHIGQQLQLQPVSPLFALPAGFRFPRSLVSRGSKMLIAPSSPSALGGDDALIGPAEVMHQRARLIVIKHGAHRHLQNRVHAFPAAAIGSFAVPSAFRLMLRIEAKVNQRIVPFARLHDDVAAASAISARRTAPRNKLLPPEGNATIAPIPRLDANPSLINKHSHPSVAPLPPQQIPGAPHLARFSRDVGDQCSRHSAFKSRENSKETGRVP